MGRRNGHKVKLIGNKVNANTNNDNDDNNNVNDTLAGCAAIQ